MKRIIVVGGPTGVGKSAYAIDVATRLGGEVVSADSQQVYRGCDIGTGKLPVDRRQGIPHHCLDLVEPDQSFSVAHYVAAADRAIADIHARGRLPILVGGTGLYLQALVYGLCEAPPTDPGLRACLLERLRNEGPATLHRELASADPEGARRIHPHHTSRLLRALEVFSLTGESLLTIQARHGFSGPRYAAEWRLLTRPRRTLYDRIHARVEAMFAAGWIDETRRLVARFGTEIAPLRAIGYQEIVRTLAKNLDFANVNGIVKTQTRRYAKRQGSWFRRMQSLYKDSTEWREVVL